MSASITAQIVRLERTHTKGVMDPPEWPLETKNFPSRAALQTHLNECNEGLSTDTGTYYYAKDTDGNWIV